MEGKKILKPWEELSEEERQLAYEAFQRRRCRQEEAIRIHLENKTFVCPECRRTLTGVRAMVIGFMNVGLKGSMIKDDGTVATDTDWECVDSIFLCPICCSPVEVYSEENLRDEMYKKLGLSLDKGDKEKDKI